MNRYICTICGYIHEGDSPPDICPVCKADKSKFKPLNSNLEFKSEHKIGTNSKIDEELIEDLRANFNGECTEVGMYIAMSRQADREGYPEVAECYKRIAYEEADHASRFAEILGEVLVSDTKANLKARVEAEYGACEGKVKLAEMARTKDLEDIYNSVSEMAKDEARHGKAFNGLLNRYFNN